MTKISDIKSREILDSRGYPTLETTVVLENGIEAKACVPSGASKGTHEAFELRDGDKERFNGLGVLMAIENVKNKIRSSLLGIDVYKQKEIDQKMIEADGTRSKSLLGANSILSVSLATARVAAKDCRLPLYKYIKNLASIKKQAKPITPMFNVINGGLHGSGKLTFQEFLLIPNPAKSYEEALRVGVELYCQLREYLKKKNLNYSVGDEGGFTPSLSSNKKALELLKEAISYSSYNFGQDIYLGLDLAASVFYKDNSYKLIERKLPYQNDEFINYLVDLQKEFCIFSFEDPLFEDDWKGWSLLTKKMGKKVLIIGDDLLVTNLERLKKAVATKACNSILVKVNQVGTLSETLQVIKCAQEAKFKVIISHRSGETNDDFIADLAAGVGADFVKFGAPARGERVAKYNRLMEIYRELKRR